jgi:hypothetical protein
MDESNMDKTSTKTSSNSKDVSAKNIKLALVSTFGKLRTIIEQGFICGLLFVGVVSVAVYGYDTLTNNGNISGIPFTVWQFGLIATAVMVGLVVAIGLPILWGKHGGYKRVLGVISWEFILVAIALLVAAFVLNSQNNNGNTVCPIYGLNSGNNCIMPGGVVSPSQQ